MTERDISTYPPEAQAYIKELREEAKNNRLKATANLSEAQLEAQRVLERDQAIAQANAKLSELDTVKTQLAALQDAEAQRVSQAANESLAQLKLKVAKEVGIPDFAVNRINGTDETALKADAVALKADLETKAGAATFDRTNTESARTKPPSEHESLKDFIASQLQETE
jgi:hypothetical protein